MIPKYIIVHHSAVSYGKNPDQFNATNNYHQSKGFPRSSLGYYVGYQYEIAKDGTTRQARKDTEPGAHTSQQEMNFNSIGICLDGDFDNEEPTTDQIKSLDALLQGKMLEFSIPKEKVVPHRKYAPKTCWGSKLPDDILKYVKARLTNEPTHSIWAHDAIEKAKKKGIMTNWSAPQEAVTDETYQWVFQRLGALDKVTTAAMTRERFAVVLDRLGLLD